MKTEYLYTLTHLHKYGETMYAFLSHNKNLKIENEAHRQRITEVLDIDYEQGKGETLELERQDHTKHIEI